MQPEGKSPESVFQVLIRPDLHQHKDSEPLLLFFHPDIFQVGFLLCIPAASKILILLMLS